MQLTSFNSVAVGRHRLAERIMWFAAASDCTVMKLMEYTDLPTTIALMKASSRVREALKGKLKRKFWEMAFWRDRGVLLYLDQFSVPRAMTNALPSDPKKWEWRHYLQAYYSSEYTARNPRHVMFGRCVNSRIQKFLKLEGQQQLGPCSLMPTFGGVILQFAPHENRKQASFHF